MNILVVDDQLGVLVSLMMLIEGENRTIDTATDGKAALEMIKKKTYDLAFLDHNMPELTGLELIQYIKKNDIKTAIVMITGDKGMKEVLAKGYGAQEYLEKPYTPADIENILSKYSK